MSNRYSPSTERRYSHEGPVLVIKSLSAGSVSLIVSGEAVAEAEEDDLGGFGGREVEEEEAPEDISLSLSLKC